MTHVQATTIVKQAVHASPTRAVLPAAPLHLPFGVVEMHVLISQLMAPAVWKCSMVVTQLFARQVSQWHAIVSVHNTAVLATCVFTTLTSTAAALMAIQCGVEILLAMH